MWRVYTEAITLDFKANIWRLIICRSIKLSHFPSLHPHTYTPCIPELNWREAWHLIERMGHITIWIFSLEDKWRIIISAQQVTLKTVSIPVTNHLLFLLPSLQHTVVFPWLASFSYAARYIWSNSSKLQGAGNGKGNQEMIDDNAATG